MKNVSKWMLTLLLGTMCISSGWAQTKTYTIKRSLNVVKAQSFKEAHGIKVGQIFGSWSATVDVRTENNAKFRITEGCEVGGRTIEIDEPLRMYALDASQLIDPDENGLRHFRATPDKYYKPRLLFYCEKEQLADSREFYKSQAYMAYNFTSIGKFFKNKHTDVEITLTISGNIDLNQISRLIIPGVSELKGFDFLENVPDLLVDVYGSSSVTPYSSTPINFADAITPTLNFTMGDSVVFTSRDQDFYFEGLPEIWIARSGGETKYYCTESVKPGDWRPFLGYDAQVHGVALRKYPPGFKPKVPNRSINNGLFTWYWIAQRELSATISKEQFDPNQENAVLDKEKVAGLPGLPKPFHNGTNSYLTQRNNQKEGYNMELLQNFRNVSPGYNNFNADRFILGLDGDEIVYINSPEAAVNAAKKPDVMFQTSDEKWKIVPPDEFPDPIVQMADAYRRNRAFVNGEPAPDTLRAYEIKDFDMYIESPGQPKEAFNGKTYIDYFYRGSNIYGVPNPGPGKIEFKVNGASKQLSINVSPLGPSGYGFYGTITGEQYPSEFQKNVPYGFILDFIPLNLRQNLSMEYTSENELGATVKRDVRPFNPANAGSTAWTESFDIQGYGYNEITVYYQRAPGATKVPIAGKELMEVNLRFAAVAGSDYQDFSRASLPGVDIKEGRGEGKYWYLRDFNGNADANDPAYGNRDDKFTRDYTFAKGDEVTFTAMDSDPHTFIHYKAEYYVSERFMAKRLEDGELQNRIIWYVADKNDPATRTQVAYGRHCTYTWSAAGSFILTAVYNGASELSHEITVLDNAYIPTSPTWPKGEINIYELSPKQKALISRYYTGNVNDLRVAKVENIFSKYTHIDGPRALTPNGSFNRYGLEKDFNNHFKWYNGTTAISNIVDPNLLDQRSQWFPANWIRHYSGDLSKYPRDMDPAITASLLTKDQATINTRLTTVFPATPEPWQWRLPWISTTEWSGYRTRINIKAIYNLKKFFDNNTGAFSGVGNPNTQDVSNCIPAFTDEQKELYDFYLDIKSGRKLLFKTGTISNGLIVYNVNDATAENPNIQPETYIAGYTNPNPITFMKGADMSSIKNLEAKGISWSPPVGADPYNIISIYGMNTVRLRLWVDPKYANDPKLGSKAGTSYPFSTLASVTGEIVKAKGKGLKVLLDLHLSDTWTDPKQNIIPASWKVNGKVPDVATLEGKIRSYVEATLQSLHNLSALPDYVQIGNETNSNILLSAPYDQLTLAQVAAEIGVLVAQMKDQYTINWDRNATLLNAGLDQAKQFFIRNGLPNNKTMLHIAGPADAEWWIGQAFTNIGRTGLGTAVINPNLVNLLGISYYPGEAGQQQSLPELKRIIERIYSKYSLPSVIVETAYPRTYSYSDNTTNLFGRPVGKYPVATDDAAQKSWLSSLIATLRQTRGSAGLLYWEPFWVGSNNATEPMKDLVGSNWENMSFFTFATGVPTTVNALASGGGIEAFCEGSCPPGAAARLAQEEPSIPKEKTLEENNDASFKVYPNPSETGDFVVEFGLTENSPMEIQIVDLTGRVMFHQDIENLDKGKHKFILGKGSKLISGLYVLEIATREFKRKEKIIVL
jgi:arabinogalactan endo-1,4-beta-galactosidase